MSILIMSKVWAFSQSTGSERLILLAIADFADDEGRAYPSVTTLAKKARVSERTAQYAIRALVDLGELAIFESKGPKGCNLYRVQNLREGCKMQQEGVQDETKGGATHCTQTVIEPSEEPLFHTAAPTGSAKVKAAPKPREPNPLLEALASVGGANPRETPPSRWSALQKYLREIKTVTPDVTAAEIARREQSYRRKYQNAAVTPDALAKHWGEFSLSAVVGEQVRCYIAPAEKVRIPDNLRDDYTA